MLPVGSTPLVSGATTFLHGKASHTILRSLALPYESCSLATPLKRGHYGCWAMCHMSLQESGERLILPLFKGKSGEAG